jgi:Siphovirus-type tail component, C-terminal domain
MLTMVTAQNVRGDTLQLPLMDSSNGFVVKEIQGLDPVKASLTSSSLAQVDGEQFQNARRGTRNITMKLGLEPDYAVTTVADLRAELYRYFMTKSVITFGVYLDDILFATTAATVETCENDMFSADPQVDISLICYDPDLYDTDTIVVSGSTVADMTTQTITYDGTSDTGVIFAITFTRSVSGITLYNYRPDGVMQIFDVNGSFLTGDTLQVKSVPGRKELTLTRAGLEYSVLYYMNPISVWITLMEGDNIFRAYVTGAAIPFTVSYVPKYGGI